MNAEEDRTGFSAMQRLLLSLPVPALAFQAGRVVACNHLLMRWLGYTSGDILQQHPARVSVQIQPDGLPSMDVFNQHVDRIPPDGQACFDWVFQDQSGHDKPCELAIKRLGAGLDVDWYLVVVQDTGRFVQLESRLSHNLDRYRQIFDSCPDPLWLVKANKFIECNEAAARVFGYEHKSALLNKHPSELSPVMQPDGEASYTKANRMGKLAWKQGSHSFEWVHLHANGEPFVAEVVLSPVELDFEPYMLCAWRDITARKKHEDMLMSIIADLQDRLEQAPTQAS